MKLLSHHSMSIFFKYVFEGVLTLFAVLFFTTIILLVSGAPPFAAYYHIFKGSLGSWIKLGQVIQVWIPLTLCAAGVLYTFRIGLWNIGVEGQVMLGAVFTTAVLRIDAAKSMPMLFIGLSFLAGISGGAIWAIVAGDYPLADIRTLAASRNRFHERNRTISSGVMASHFSGLSAFPCGAGSCFVSPGFNRTVTALYAYGVKLESHRE